MTIQTLKKLIQSELDRSASKTLLQERIMFLLDLFESEEDLIKLPNPSTYPISTFGVPNMDTDNRLHYHNIEIPQPNFKG